MSVDSLGAVYVIGVPANAFEPTAGAFQTTWPKSVYSMSKGYALKIAPTLDHVVYATLLYQGQSYGATSPTAIAVDGAGNATSAELSTSLRTSSFQPARLDCP